MHAKRVQTHPPHLRTVCAIERCPPTGSRRMQTIQRRNSHSPYSSRHRRAENESRRCINGQGDHGAQVGRGGGQRPRGAHRPLGRRRRSERPAWCRRGRERPGLLICGMGRSSAWARGGSSARRAEPRTPARRQPRQARWQSRGWATPPDRRGYRQAGGRRSARFRRSQ